MIEKIYIPTIKRADIQITYENLPKQLQQRVVFVIDPKERKDYKYDAEYLEIPESFIGQWTQLAQTRKFIHQHGKNTKYAMFDDDLIILKRNQKYINGNSDMEKSKRKATEEEILQCFEKASKWLDDEEIGIVGLCDPGYPPHPKEYTDTQGVFCSYFIDGRKLAPFVDELDTSIRIGEDLLFLFDCMSRGMNTRISNEYLYENKSLRSIMKGKRPIWEEIEKKDNQIVYQTDDHINAMKYIQKKYPHAMDIFIEDGKYKFRKYWKKIYNKKVELNLESFYD